QFDQLVEVDGKACLRIKVELIGIAVVGGLVAAKAEGGDDFILQVEFFLHEKSLVLLEEAKLVDVARAGLIEIGLRADEVGRLAEDGIAFKIFLRNDEL